MVKCWDSFLTNCTFPMGSTGNNELHHLDPVLQQFYDQESNALIIGHLTPESEGTHKYDFATTHEWSDMDHGSIQSPYNSEDKDDLYGPLPPQLWCVRC